MRSYLGSTPTIDSIATQVNGKYIRLPIDLEKPLKEPSKSIYKEFKQHPLDREPYAVEMTKSELARNGKLASCWF
jgi:hypothetical protein